MYSTYRLLETAACCKKNHSETCPPSLFFGNGQFLHWVYDWVFCWDFKGTISDRLAKLFRQALELNGNMAKAPCSSFVDLDVTSLGIAPKLQRFRSSCYLCEHVWIKGRTWLCHKIGTPKCSGSSCVVHFFRNWSGMIWPYNAINIYAYMRIILSYLHVTCLFKTCLFNSLTGRGCWELKN